MPSHLKKSSHYNAKLLASFTVKNNERFKHFVMIRIFRNHHSISLKRNICLYICKEIKDNFRSSEIYI